METGGSIEASSMACSLEMFALPVPAMDRFRSKGPSEEARH